jgi:hypothetical protein
MNEIHTEEIQMKAEAQVFACVTSSMIVCSYA